MNPLRFGLLFLLSVFFISHLSSQTSVIRSKIQGMTAYEGYFDFFWDKTEGKIWLLIDKLDTEFLYVNSLPAGIGSNDIGLDRGQLGQNRIVKFVRSGPKILLVHLNYDYRAASENPDERRSVEEAFAQSVLWGFEVAAEDRSGLLVDMTDFLLQDAHDVIGRLQFTEQGTYKLDPSRSAIYLPRTKNFPKNSEFEATLTFTGRAQGDLIKTVTPSSEAVTVRQHHSFIELPDDQYKARPLDPRSGFFGIAYHDYARPITQPLVQRFIARHRLQKKEPGAARSEAVEPIIYYIDPGAPEPVKSALIEGASWWNEAFEYAGYKDAFQVKELPPDADPMDVRYNLIQWVHRSTRGWSYGSTVTDPRTGEIIKGLVSLGSLRVRQDFLIAQGLLLPYENGTEPDPRALEMALARLRQLSAHEVGHTLGLTHNFSASIDGRESVMDYPHPYITLNEEGELDFSKAYRVGLGQWDKRAILYGYQDFRGKGIVEEEALKQIIETTLVDYQFISDQDSRPQGGAHAYGHLWDNGNSPVEELKRILVLRKYALERFGPEAIAEGSPMSNLERVLVPLYLAHRYQTEAAVKQVGGVFYNYALRGDLQSLNQPLHPDAQMAALLAVLQTLDTRELALPEHIIRMIPPQAFGYERDRELFQNYTGPTFDPLAAAETAANQTISLLLHPDRLARVVEQHALDENQMSLGYLLEMLFTRAFFNDRENGYQEEVALIVEKLTVLHVLQLAANPEAMSQVRAMATYYAEDLGQQLKTELDAAETTRRKAHCYYLLEQIRMFKENPERFREALVKELPAGSPIGNGQGAACGGQ